MVSKAGKISTPPSFVVGSSSSSVDRSDMIEAASKSKAWAEISPEGATCRRVSPTIVVPAAASAFELLLVVLEEEEEVRGTVISYILLRSAASCAALALRLFTSACSSSYSST